MNSTIREYSGIVTIADDEEDPRLDVTGAHGNRIRAAIVKTKVSNTKLTEVAWNKPLKIDKPDPRDET